VRRRRRAAAPTERSRIRPARNSGYKASRWFSTLPAAPGRYPLAAFPVPIRRAGRDRVTGFGRDDRQRYLGGPARAAAAPPCPARRGDRGRAAALRWWRERTALARSTARWPSRGDARSMAWQDRPSAIRRLRHHRAGCVDRAADLDVRRPPVQQRQSRGPGERGAQFRPQCRPRHSPCSRSVGIGGRANPGGSVADIGGNSIGGGAKGRTGARPPAIGGDCRWRRCALPGQQVQGAGRCLARRCP